MKHLALALVVSALAPTACSTTNTNYTLHETELTLLVPEALRADEPSAQRVTLLFASGLALVFDNAIARRVDDQIFVDRGPDTPALGFFAVKDVRAVQRYSTRPTRRR